PAVAMPVFAVGGIVTRDMAVVNYRRFSKRCDKPLDLAPSPSYPLGRAANVSSSVSSLLTREHGLGEVTAVPHGDLRSRRTVRGWHDKARRVSRALLGNARAGGHTIHELEREGLAMKGLRLGNLLAFISAAMLATLTCTAFPAAAQEKKPNILVIMGDDVGWFNVGAYHRGIMSGKTPNLDKLAAAGMMFTDYYAEASCTAGRANFITGEIPLRTGLTTVGQAGADVGIPAQACTLATALKAQGYETGQFGKNHLGDLNKFLPTVHGFDEFFGYLYHLDALSDPYWYSFPVDEKFYNEHGPRSVIHSYATDKDDPTDMPRWGKVGKQKIVDEGPLPPFPDMSNVPNMHDLPFLKAKYDMTTFDEVLVKASSDFMDKAKKDGKPFFVWHNTTRMHVWTFLAKKYTAMENSQTNYGLEEAGVAQLDDAIGA